MMIYVAFAAPHGGAGPQDAYARQFTSLDANALMNEPPPKFEEAEL